MRSLNDIIQFNKAHADIELPPGTKAGSLRNTPLTDLTPDHPDQDRLILASNQTISDKEYEYAKEFGRRVAGSDGVGKVLADHGLDVIVALLDSPICAIATAAGLSQPAEACSTQQSAH